jgi:hypothetical protein
MRESQCAPLFAVAMSIRAGQGAPDALAYALAFALSHSSLLSTHS